MRRLEVITGEVGRRRWSAEAKSRIVVEASAPGAVVSAVARRHGLRPQQVFAWRRQARRGELVLPGDGLPMFAAVVAASEPETAPADAAAIGAEVVVELGKVRLRIGPEVMPSRLAALIAALRAAG